MGHKYLAVTLGVLLPHLHLTTKNGVRQIPGPERVAATLSGGNFYLICNSKANSQVSWKQGNRAPNGGVYAKPKPTLPEASLQLQLSQKWNLGPVNQEPPNQHDWGQLAAWQTLAVPEGTVALHHPPAILPSVSSLSRSLLLMRVPRCLQSLGSFLSARLDGACFRNPWIKPIRSFKFTQLNFVFTHNTFA